MRRRQLLLVEDNADNREVLTLILSEKYSVSSYGSVAEALTALEGISADVLVLDIDMTPIDGLQCLEAIRAMPGYSPTPAIALTAHVREVDRQAFVAAGFQAVVAKPIVDYQELEAIIEALLKCASSTATVNA